MTASDILLIVAIMGFLVTWWVRSVRWRRQLLLVWAVVALAAGVWGVYDERWQAGVRVFVSLVFLLAVATSALRGGSRGGIPYVSGPLLTLTGGLAIAAIYLFPVWGLPAPSGPHAVGVRTFELDDASRLGVFHAAADAPRRLLVRVWHPAEPEPGASTRPYFSDGESRTTARSMGTSLGFPAFLTYLKHVRTNACEDAPLVAGAGALPTIFYSHGYGSSCPTTTRLCASGGWPNRPKNATRSRAASMS